MPSTPSAYPQVFSRCLALFRVVDSTVIPGQVDFCAWFDSRQLHQRKLAKGQKPWPAFCFINVSSKRRRLSSPFGVASGWHAQGRQQLRAGTVPARWQAVFDLVRRPGFGQEVPEVGRQVRACKGTGDAGRRSGVLGHHASTSGSSTTSTTPQGRRGRRIPSHDVARSTAPSLYDPARQRHPADS